MNSQYNATLKPIDYMDQNIRKMIKTFEFIDKKVQSLSKTKHWQCLSLRVKLNMDSLITKDMYDVAIPICIMNDGSVFQFGSYVRGYHAYMNIWEPLLGKCLKCVKEPTNEADKHAVAVVHINSLSKEVVVGLVPKFISMIVSMFLSLPWCTLGIEVTGKRVNRGVGYGLEIPAKFHFYGPENAIVWIRSKITNIEKKLSQNVNRCLK